MESSCALRKASLKRCQLYSVPLSLRTVSQGISSNVFLKLPEVCSPAAQDPDFTLCQACVPQDHELNQGMVTAAQAASDLNFFSDLFCVVFPADI